MFAWTIKKYLMPNAIVTKLFIPGCSWAADQTETNETDSSTTDRCSDHSHKAIGRQPTKTQSFVNNLADITKRLQQF